MSNKVFISYRHESEAHRARVRDLAERLEQAGLTVVLDQLAQQREFHGGGPNEGWPRWSKNQAGNPAHKVLIIASVGWFRCYTGTGLSGSGLGAAAEAVVIDQRLYNTAGINPDIRIATFESLDSFSLPLDLQRYHRFSDPSEFSDLVAWLTGMAQGSASPVVVKEWPETPSSLDWPIADHVKARAAFEQLLTRTVPWRFLPLRGPSDSGKTYITEQMLSNALRIPGLACGLFNFKGTTDVETLLRAFVQNLEVQTPLAGGRLNERFGQIFDSLRRRARPALLIFDTYEAAGEAQDWVEKELLPSLIRGTWLRVVIAGQIVPATTGVAWSPVSCTPLHLASPPPEDWLTYGLIFGQPHKKEEFTIDKVRLVYKLCDGKASYLAQMLGPGK